MVKLDLLSNTFLLLVFTKPSLTMNLLMLQCIYILKITSFYLRIQISALGCALHSLATSFGRSSCIYRLFLVRVVSCLSVVDICFSSPETRTGARTLRTPVPP